MRNRYKDSYYGCALFLPLFSFSPHRRFPRSQPPSPDTSFYMGVAAVACLVAILGCVNSFLNARKKGPKNRWQRWLLHERNLSYSVSMVVAVFAVLCNVINYVWYGIEAPLFLGGMVLFFIYLAIPVFCWLYQKARKRD